MVQPFGLLIMFGCKHNGIEEHENNDKPIKRLRLDCFSTGSSHSSVLANQQDNKDTLIQPFIHTARQFYGTDFARSFVNFSIIVEKKYQSLIEKGTILRWKYILL